MLPPPSFPTNSFSDLNTEWGVVERTEKAHNVVNSSFLSPARKLDLCSLCSGGTFSVFLLLPNAQMGFLLEHLVSVVDYNMTHALILSVSLSYLQCYSDTSSHSYCFEKILKIRRKKKIGYPLDP
ncbi:uncharacterized protein LOC126604331 [Malus sylvestris]|uniref:uncharacterized protein LOC126604331 n=1 Tax=Malus sylvestris TaxID=3752 RepID=UPI0021AD0468|nr:uncharacterized protein LOC126604331 [Malus sylvestris]